MVVDWHVEFGGGLRGLGLSIESAKQSDVAVTTVIWAII